MIQVHCDVSDCKSTTDLEYVPGSGLKAPDKWARVQWCTEIQPEKTSQQRAMEKLKKLAGGGQEAHIVDVLASSLSTQHAEAEMTAYICPGCLEKLSLVTFGVRRDQHSHVGFGG